ncbi:MAG: molybdate ABC transporter permease subunit [Saprospiraceae bacterium]|nr:molybdate ABC transporter permease subunit [Saprospiraceae bacterium]MDP4997983.1 molybdate ABC transporter permease subunit [Saprospiraceae bacterium]
MDMFYETLSLTLHLAFTATCILLMIGIPMAYWLSRTQSAWKPFFEAVISLPLVLPPTVLGFYLLLALSPNSALGNFLATRFGIQLIFSFEGLIVGSVIYSLPFMVQPIQSGFENLPKNLAEAAYVLGKSRWVTLFRVLLPNIKPSIITAIVLTFAHTIGEFGVILMIGGNIPGETRVASIAIYDEVEAMNYDTANQYALVLVIFSFLILFMVYALNKKYFHIKGR